MKICDIHIDKPENPELCLLMGISKATHILNLYLNHKLGEVTSQILPML